MIGALINLCVYLIIVGVIYWAVTTILGVIDSQHKTFEECVMADFTKVMAELADLSAKVDALLAKQNPPPVDEQPAVDQVAAAVEAIAAKIPA
jgi:hypothetical protein